jgi:cell filamentation protein
MALGGYDAFDDPYAYRGTRVLKNRLALRDSGLLEAFELEMTTLRADEPLPAGRFGAAHYCQVHHHLFQDVYRWAGRYRTVRTAKGGNVFCYPENIAAEMEKLFARLAAQDRLRGRAWGEFAQGAVAFLGDLNAIHPFREGNGRAQLAFLHLLADEAGHPLRLAAIQQDTFLPAMVASFSGDLDPLIVELGTLRA